MWLRPQLQLCRRCDPVVSGNGNFLLTNFIKDPPTRPTQVRPTLTASHWWCLYEDADLLNDRDLYLFQGNDSDHSFLRPHPGADWNVIISDVDYGGREPLSSTCT